MFRAVERLCAEDAEGFQFTTMAIIRESGISRGTFYAHFPTLEDLAEQMLEARFAQIGEADRKDRREALDAAASSPQADLRRPAEDSQLALARFVQDHRGFFRASLEWRLASRVHERVVEAHAAQIAETLRVMGPAVPPHIDHTAFSLFLAGGSVALLTDWLREPDPIPPDAMAERLLSTMPEWLVGPPPPSQIPDHPLPDTGPASAPTAPQPPGETS